MKLLYIDDLEEFAKRVAGKIMELYTVKESGKGLSRNDYSDEDKKKLDSIEEGANRTKIENDLFATERGTALDAVQGKVLKDLYDALKTKFDSFEAAKSKIVGSAFGGKIGLTSASSMAEAAEAISGGNAGILWKNTENGTYKFAQSGARWIANNRGVNSSTATSTWTVEVLKAATAYIGYRTASESADKLSITLNGVSVLSATGGNKANEAVITLNLAAGVNTLTAVYTKDGSVHSYGDMAYVVLPPIGEQPGQYKYQSKSVTPSTSTKTVTPDTGYDGLYSVSVAASSGGYKMELIFEGNSREAHTVDVTEYTGYKNFTLDNFVLKDCSIAYTSTSLSDTKDSILSSYDASSGTLNLAKSTSYAYRKSSSNSYYGFFINYSVYVIVPN